MAGASFPMSRHSLLSAELRIASASDKKGGGLSRLIAGRGRAGCRGTHRFSRAWRLMWGRRPARRPHGVLDCSSKRLGQRGWDCVGDLLDLGREGSF